MNDDLNLFTTFVVNSLQLRHLSFIFAVEIVKKYFFMKKKKYPQPSEAEFEILQVLWENQPTTVREVFEKLSKSRDVGYTTILKQMQRMFEKGIVTRTKEGKTHLYSSVPKEKEIQNGMLNKMVKTAFKGSKMDLVLQVLGNSKTSPEELDALQKWLQQQKNK